MSNYAIAVKFSLEDEVSAKIGQIGRQLRSLDSISGMSKKLIGNTFGAVKAVAAPAFSALSSGVAHSARSYVQFDDTLTAANAKFGGTAETMRELREAALDVAGATRFNSLDTAGALDKMAMAGMNATDSIAVLGPMANMAMATGKDMTSAVDMATDALGAFNLMKDAAGEPLGGEALAAQLSRMSDTVSKATTAANFDMDMWFESAKQGASTFTSFGGTLEEFTAIAGLLANSGVKGSAGGTAIRNIMLGMSGTTETAKASLEALGIQSFDAEGRMRPFADLIEQLTAGLSGLSDEDKALHLSKLFGKENISSALLLVQEGADKIREFTGELAGAAGATDAMAVKMNSSIGGKMEMVKSALGTLGQRFISAFDTERGRALIDSLAEKIGLFAETVIPQLSQSLGTVLPQVEAGIEAVFQALPSVIDGIASAVPEIMSLISKGIEVAKVLWRFRAPLLFLYGIVALANPLIQTFRVLATAKSVFFGIKDGALIASKSIQGLGDSAAIARRYASPFGNAFGTMFTGIGKGGKAMVEGLKAFGGAFVGAVSSIAVAIRGFFVSSVVPFLTNPVTWIILGIVAAVALLSFGIYQLVKHWDAVSAAVGRFADWLAAARDRVDAFFEGIHNMEGVGGAIAQFLVRPFETLWGLARGVVDVFQAFKDGGFVNGIKMLGLAILQFIFTPIQAILDTISLIPGINIGDKARAWFDETRAGLLNPKDAAGAEAVTAVAESGGPAVPVEPVNQRTVTEAYSESTSRLDISLADGLSGKFSGAAAPNVTLDTGKRAAGF